VCKCKEFVLGPLLQKMAEEQKSLEQTPTWALATVATVFVVVSLLLERGINCLGRVSSISNLLHLSLSLSLCAQG
jgi:hypothetical protein